MSSFEDEDDEQEETKPQKAVVSKKKSPVKRRAPGTRQRKQTQKLDPSQIPDKKRFTEYELEKIVADRIRKGKQEFKVRWKGYGRTTTHGSRIRTSRTRRGTRRTRRR